MYMLRAMICTSRSSEGQRRLADEHPELLQQARRGQGEVVGVDVSVELALEVEECVEETAVEVRDRE